VGHYKSPHLGTGQYARIVDGCVGAGRSRFDGLRLTFVAPDQADPDFSSD